MNFSVRPSARSKSLARKLHAVAHADQSQSTTIGALSSSPIAETGPFHASLTELAPSFSSPLERKDLSPKQNSKGPSTPPGQSTLVQKPQFEDFIGHEESVCVVREEELANIPRYKMENPFVEQKSRTTEAFKKPVVDSSTHTEYINHTTGERKTVALTEEQKRFKPRKLVFALDAEMTGAGKLASKYVGSQMGKHFSMKLPHGDATPSFAIFQDDSLSDSIDA